MAERQLMRLLLVDADGLNRYTVSKALQRVGYDVLTMASGEAALARYSVSDFDLVLVDMALPGLIGLELLAALKKQSPDAIVILLDAAASIERAVQALRLGAADYLLKPCSSEDIRASVERGTNRARSLRRRRRLLDAIERMVADLAREVSAVVQDAGGSAPPRQQLRPAGSAIALGYFSLLPGTYQVEAEGEFVSLTPTEFDMLLYLAAHRRRIVSCQELVQEVRGYPLEEAAAREVVRPHISNLRRKLRQLGDIELIVNARGLGYRLVEETDSDQDDTESETTETNSAETAAETEASPS